MKVIKMSITVGDLLSQLDNLLFLEEINEGTIITIINGEITLT